MPNTDQPGACWLLLSPEGYEFRRTPFDVETAAEEIRNSNDPNANEFATHYVINHPTAVQAMEVFERMVRKQNEAQPSNDVK
ncbi:MAG TPA: hypothetical protein VE710_14925 [Candidatus Bathyarchaeia archaeon]|nr:hypothetical protein [Candidatus Bathyarchaeia archaeon]